MDSIRGALLTRAEFDDKYFHILGSTVSLGQYEKRNLKNLMPQIWAALVVSLVNLVTGTALIFSAILIPQLEEHKEFEFNETDASWISSILALVIPLGTFMAGYLMDTFGRLNAMKISAIPTVLGWVVIALAGNVPVLMLGRILNGVSLALNTTPAIVYITEIARADMRAALTSLVLALSSLGMVLTFLKGWFLTWRQVAWISNIYAISSLALIFFIPESPAWLVSKNRIEEARKALNWLYKHQPQPENKTENFAGLQLALLLKEHELKMIENGRRDQGGCGATIREFLKPTGYRPMLVLFGTFVSQQFSGIFIFMFYSINFFQATGTQINPYLASMFIGIVRCAMSLANGYVMKEFGRRPLLIASCLGMSTCIFLSALFTHFIKEGITTLNWLPVIFLLGYVICSMLGIILIPVTMSAELFPVEIRGLANSICWGLANILMFLALLSYPWMISLFNGIVGVQVFFGVVTIFGAVHAYVFLPETHNVKLGDIQEYFKDNVMFLKRKPKEIKSEARRVEVKKNIVRSTSEECSEKCLLEEVLHPI